MVADREHHFFIDTLTSLVTREAHRNHLCRLINKKLLLKFKKHQYDPGVNGQMPQICESLPLLLNTFPGITKTSTECQNVRISKQQCDRNTDHVKRVACPTANTVTDESKGMQLQTLPVSTENNNEQKVMDPNASSQESTRDKSLLEHKEKLKNTEYQKEKTDKKKTDDKKDKVSNADCQVILKIEATVQPETESNYQKTLQALFDHLKSEEQRKRMETFLSTECETPVIIDGITLGSIIIHITCDVKALKPLQFLSETDHLSSKFTNLFVTEDFLEKCNVCQVTLDVKLRILDEKILKTLTPMIYTLPFTLSLLGKTFKIKAPVQMSGEVQWFHNDVPITGGDRIQIVTEEDKSCYVKVTDACVADTGVYSCKYTSTEGFPVLVKGSVLVLNQSAPSNVKAVAEGAEEIRIDVACGDIAEYYAEKRNDVSWDHAVGDITGYNIIYSHGLAGDSYQTLSNGVTTNRSIHEVLPGETYNISVCSISDEVVSDPEPPGGITVHTPAETPVGELIPEPYVSGSYKVTWVKPRKDGVYIGVTLSNNIYVIPIVKEEFRIQLLKKPSTASFVSGHQICSRTISSFYKGKISEKVDLNTVIDYQRYRSLPGLVIRESKEEYYNSIKDESYPVSLQTVTRGRAVVFITGGIEMQYRTDLDLLRLFASLSIQFWLIYDPDVDVINFYLKEMGQIMEQDTVDYCFVFFIGSCVRHGIDTHFITEKMESFNIFDKCNNLQQAIPSNLKKPIFVFIGTSVASEFDEMSSEVPIGSSISTDPPCSDMFFLYTNTDNESSKWWFLNSWVDSVTR